MDNLQQMREVFQKTYGGLGLLSEIEAALLGAWCLAWTAGAEAAQEDAIGLACVNGIINDMTAETQDDFRDNFLRSWVGLVDRKGYWTESDAEWKSLPEFSDLAAQTSGGLPCIVRLARSGYRRGVSHPDGTYIADGEPCPPEKTCYRWFVPDYGQEVENVKHPSWLKVNILQAASEWIPVSEQLPEMNTFVLVKGEVGVPHVASLQSGKWWLPSPRGWKGDTWEPNLITHWKPL